MKNPARARFERGVTLVPALIISLLVMGISGAVVSNALHRYAAERDRGEQTVAEFAAEAGRDVALYEVQAQADLGADGIGVASGNVTGGSYVATISPAFSGTKIYTISSTGTSGSQRRNVQLVINYASNSVSGVIGLNGVTVNGTPNFDSYSSTTGTYASQVKGGHAANKGGVASNGNISASGSGTMFGDATPGPGGKYSGNFKVTGSTAPAGSKISEPAFVYKPPGVAKTALSGSGTLTAGTYQYTSLSLKSKDLLKITGNVTLYIDGAISSTGQAQIEVTAGSKLTINQGKGDISIAGGGIVNDLANPAALQINSASTTSVSIAGNADLYGLVYAPAAAFSKVGTANFFGTVVASTVTVSGTGWMHTDSSALKQGTPTVTVVALNGQ
jgi:hypothetical protein